MGRSVVRPGVVPGWVVVELGRRGYGEEEAAVIAAMFVANREGRAVEGPEARAELTMCEMDRLAERRRPGDG